VKVYHRDSRKNVFQPIDGVITSPPYVGLIDYHEQHAYAYHLLGLEDRRDKEIGSASNGLSKKAQKLYQENLAEVFIRAKDAMPKGGRIIIVAADTKKLYEEIAHLSGMEIEGIINRHVNRRTGRRANKFYESVFIWKKKDS
jgi:DNA modification methylase